MRWEKPIEHPKRNRRMSSEVPSSSWCELEGLKRSIRFLTEQHIKCRPSSQTEFGRLPSGCGRSCVQKEQAISLTSGISAKICILMKVVLFCSETGLGKALDAAAKDYWTAASTPNGDVMEAKRKSMVNHVQDIHERDTPNVSLLCTSTSEGGSKEQGVVGTRINCSS
ncbi:hypothetical protein G5714_004602 [Onychostoma macrolepis]|uniref:Uncharacterized protein n=1 Tax=Onychostoma macrolepis TaxID=369639 RepID=A0A7J6D538_9TELE|nr:hypothetical protein G5714_004602 [Onychostoma macrolepis]